MSALESHTELKFIFANVNEWLKFAEAKHAGLVVLNAAFLAGIVTSFQLSNPPLDSTFAILGITCLSISIIVSMLSQYPWLRKLILPTNPAPGPNIYFYGSISRMDDKNFIKEFSQKCGLENLSQLDNDLIHQIIVNAKITTAKYKLFKAASIASLCGFLFIIIPPLIETIWPSQTI